MTAFHSKWLSETANTPTVVTDKTDKSPSVSFVRRGPGHIAPNPPPKPENLKRTAGPEKTADSNPHRVFRRGQAIQTKWGPGTIWETYEKLGRIGVMLDGHHWPRFVSPNEVTQSGRFRPSAPPALLRPGYKPLKLFKDDDDSLPAQIHRQAVLAIQRVCETYEKLPRGTKVDLADEPSNPKSIEEIEQWEIGWLEKLQGLGD